MKKLTSDAPSIPSTASGRSVITVVSGCMFSGKTTELLRRLERSSSSESLAFKHAIDDRYSPGAIVSHAGKAYPAHAITSSSEIEAYVDSGIELVAIDEAHWFDSSLVDVVSSLAAGQISVIAALLDRNSWGQPFTVAQRLNAIADEPIARHAVCARCNRPADRTQRLTPIVGGDLVGGPEAYEPRCRRCWRAPPEPPPPMA